MERRRRRHHLTWVANTPNRKTGRIPTAYVGRTVEECDDSCRGCALRDQACYAWSGFAPVSLKRIAARREADPHRYTLESALQRRPKTARAVRIGAMGDPAHARRDELDRAVRRCREEGLAVIQYTHFWREPYAQDLKDVCLASTDCPDEAREAVAAGWIATTILPWDHYDACGPRFYMPGTAHQGFVCPAQTKPGVTCNDCRMCSPSHPVWNSGKVQAVGFLDHSRAAQREKRRMLTGRQLPLFGRGVDTRKAALAVTGRSAS